MLTSILAPLKELHDKWNAEIRDLEKKEKTERLQINRDYEAECRRIEEEHSRIITEINAAINAKNDEIGKQKDILLQNEREVLFGERKTQIDSEQKEHQKKMDELGKEIADLDELVKKEQEKCRIEVERLKTHKLAGWRLREKELSDIVSLTEKRLDDIEGSFQKFLESEVPGWEDTIGKVVDDDILFSKELSPTLEDDGRSLYGVRIDLSKTGKTPASIDGLQKTLMDSRKELSSISAYVANPDIALQTEISGIEDPYNKKIRRVP
jgi:Protein of unknown function (DUF3584).